MLNGNSSDREISIFKERMLSVLESAGASLMVYGRIVLKFAVDQICIVLVRMTIKLMSGGELVIEYMEGIIRDGI